MLLKKFQKGVFLTYEQVAQKAGSPKAYRAVGNILNKSCNIPCHRVIKKDGRVGGYNKGVNKKVSLLKREGVVIRNMKVVL
jgi:O-6-methylguanine DNA methyltransferase